MTLADYWPIGWYVLGMAFGLALIFKACRGLFNHLIFAVASFVGIAILIIIIMGLVVKGLL